MVSVVVHTYVSIFCTPTTSLYSAHYRGLYIFLKFLFCHHNTTCALAVVDGHIVRVHAGDLVERNQAGDPPYWWGPQVHTRWGHRGDEGMVWGWRNQGGVRPVYRQDITCSATVGVPPEEHKLNWPLNLCFCCWLRCATPTPHTCKAVGQCTSVCV